MSFLFAMLCSLRDARVKNACPLGTRRELEKYFSKYVYSQGKGNDETLYKNVYNTKYYKHKLIILRQLERTV